MSPTKRKRRRPLRVATDRAPVDVLPALSDGRALRRAGLDDLQLVFAAARRRVNRAMMGTLRRTDAQVGVDVLIVLGSGRAITDYVERDRWPSVRAALELDVPISEVSKVLSLDDIEVRAGLGSWARRLLDQGSMDDAGYREVLALADAGSRP